MDFTAIVEAALGFAQSIVGGAGEFEAAGILELVKNFVTSILSIVTGFIG